jgi:glycosyltransferase involved in cell wall biosynthesis
MNVLARQPGRRATMVSRVPRHVAFYFHDLSGGGVERMRLALIARLLAAGMEVTLLLHRAEGELLGLVPAGARVIGFATWRTLRDVAPLARFLGRERPDFLVASLDHNNIAALVAKAAALSGTCVIACQHNALSSEARTGSFKYRIVPPAYRLLAPLASRFVAVSRGVAEDLADCAGIDPRRIEVIHNPVIGEDFDARANVEVMHRWFGHRAMPVIVTAGRLVAQKDQATLLDAMALLRKRLPARLIVLGSGPLREALQERAASLGIAEYVDLFGFVANPLPFMRMADVFALSSVHEGFGNVLVEAMACGTPVVATDCPHGPAEILLDGRLGRLVPPGDAEALAEALWRSLTCPRPRAALRERAEEFTTERAARSWLALFERVLAEQA